MEHTKQKFNGAGEKRRLLFLLLAVFFQLGALVVGLIVLTKTFAALQAAFMLFALIALVHLQSRPLSFELKYPWAVLLLLFPIISPVLYCLLSFYPLGKRKKQMLSKIYLEGKRYRLRSDISVNDAIVKSTGFFPARRTQAKYFSTGEDFFDSLKIDLAKAKKFIFLEYFILADGTLWRELEEILLDRAKNGVEIKILYDDFGSLRRISAKNFKNLVENGVKVQKFNPTSPILSAVANNRDHRKVAIIDGEKVYLGGCNVGDEYVNRINRFGNWKDATLCWRGEGVDCVTLAFLELWSFATQSVTDFSPYLSRAKINLPKGDSLQPFFDGPTPFYSEQLSENVYVSMIERAKKSIYIMTPYFIVGNRLIEALCFAVRRGVKVTIIIPGVPDKKAVYLVTKLQTLQLLERGINVYIYTPGFLHSKVMLCDCNCAVVGSINFDYRSLRHHFECGVKVKGEVVKQIQTDFTQTLKESTLLTVENKQTPLQKTIASILLLFAPLL